MDLLCARPAVRGLTSAALCLLFAACGRTATTAGPGPTLPPGPSTTTLASAPGPSAATSTTGPSDDAATHDDAGALSPARRTQLGITGPGAGLAPLSARQWSDPQAVAARFVLADTTYAAAEEPAAVNARRAAYATTRLAADLSTSSSGAARLEELRRRQARFTGEVLSIITASDTGQVAVVELSAAVTMTTADGPLDRRVRFYRLTMGRDGPGSQWLVARAEQS